MACKHAMCGRRRRPHIWSCFVHKHKRINLLWVRFDKSPLYLFPRTCGRFGVVAELIENNNKLNEKIPTHLRREFRKWNYCDYYIFRCSYIDAAHAARAGPGWWLPCHFLCAASCCWHADRCRAFFARIQFSIFPSHRYRRAQFAILALNGVRWEWKRLSSSELSFRHRKSHPMHGRISIRHFR